MSGPRSLQRIAGERLINQLTDAVSSYQASANFSCGGSVDVGYDIFGNTTQYGDFTSTKKPISSPPVIIHWDAPRSDVSRKITFPVRSGQEKVLQQLVEDCRPATFGFEGKDVLDEKIRKAGKLEAREFSTSFNPYDFGIVNAVAQALLPGIVRPAFQDKNTRTEHWGIVAELYKLNVYSAPSDMFKPHVDTPRGLTQFGSLVVCLPNPHKGGQLRVAHKDAERIFDLGSKENYGSFIHWAAFYSDCEHEVLPVTSGHRVTLTYQLYVSEHLSGLTHPKFPTTNLKLYPLYQSIKEMLSSPIFMKNGGILGFHCAYQYADAVCGTYFYPRYAHALKGIDAVLVTIFRVLGLTIHLEPVPEGKFGKEDNHPKDTITSATSKFLDLITIEGETGEEPEDRKVSVFRDWYWYLKLGVGGTAEIAEQLPKFYGGADIFEYAKWFNERADHEVGKGYHEVATPVWNWIGNEAEIDWWYSFMALLVEIPVYSKRKLEG